MSNYVKISTIGSKEPDFGSLPKNNFSVHEKEIKAELQSQIDLMLCDNPDLIVLPECANRYVPNTRVELKEYYKYLGDSIVEFLKPIARDNNTNIAYSAVRYTGKDEPKPYRNSTVYIGRQGEIRGIYDKNFIMIEGNTLSDMAYGTEANLVELDFGKVASAICFDLNFDELLDRYKVQKPDLIVFCSMYHGGLMRQAQWAYTCRSYLASAVGDLQSGIINPYGDIVAKSTIYTKHTSARINLDYELCHIDYNREKIWAAKKKYKEALTVYDPDLVGSVMLSCESDDMTVNDIISEFEIEKLDDYLDRVRAHRRENMYF